MTLDRTRTHWAHVGVVAIHALCCGLPIMLSVLGLAVSAALLPGVLAWHGALHERELWLLAISAALVAVGAFAEWRFMRADRTRRISVLFAASLACFALNGALVAGHRTGAFPVEASIDAH
jgi:hypothetical protein